MEIASFDPRAHYDAVASLWERALGDRYPVTDRVLLPRVWTRPSFEEGDGLVALEGGRVAGFGILERGRPVFNPGGECTIQALLVDPAAQRSGIGRALLARLEDRMRQQGIREAAVSRGLYRFWTGVPDDLPAARAFFESQGYRRNHEAIDMFAPLEGFEADERDRRCLEQQSAEVASATEADFGRVYDLLTREAPGWRGSLVAMAASGDLGNVLVIRRRGEVIGQVQTFTPRSRFRAANLVWERLCGADVGGFGAVLVAQKWRGRGLGVALIRAAASHVKRCGGTGCFIDWTSHALAPFYARIGASVWKTAGMYGKAL